MPHWKDHPLDSAACNAEDLSHIGAIQDPFALVLICPERGTVVGASENLADVTGVPEDTFRLAPAETLLAPGHNFPAPDLLRAGVHLDGGQRVELANGAFRLARAFRAGACTGVVLDPAGAGESPQFDATQVHHLLAINSLMEAELSKSTPEVSELAAALAESFREISGFDRTMVYRFDSDMNGTVIAEARTERAVESFYGLTFPATDIPRPARHLFLKSRVRPIVNVVAAPHPIRGFDGLEAGDIDLTECPERAVAAIHTEYQRNMGLTASLTIALVVKEQLWGLIANHHYSGPRHLHPVHIAKCRAACDLLTAGLTRISDARQGREHARIVALADDMRAATLDLDARRSVAELRKRFGPRLLKALDASGVVLRVGGRDIAVGALPDPETVEALFQRTATWSARVGQRAFASNHASGLWTDLKGILPRAAGVAAYTHPDGRIAVLAVRPVYTPAKTWPGDPELRSAPVGSFRHVLLSRNGAARRTGAAGHGTTLSARGWWTW